LPAALEVWHSFGQATRNAERSATSLVRLLAEESERTIQAIDFTLIGMRDALLVAPNLPPYDPAFHAALKERLKPLPYVRGLFVVGPDGFAVHDSHYPPHEVSLADRPYFQVHLQDPQIGLHIGQPLRSITDGVWFVSLSRRIVKADGSFGGVVVAVVEPHYLKRFYEDLSIGGDNLIALLLRDGTLLARLPDHDETIGKSYADSRVHRLAVEHGGGVKWDTSPVDGITRIVGYRSLAGGALVALVGLSERTIYDAWLEHATIVAVASILVWTLSAGLTQLWIKYRCREQREQAQLAQVRRLEMMGRIAGGIAHDLGNTIKIARTTFTLLKPSLTMQKDAMALMDDADQSLKSAFDIIDRLLAFARRQELSPRPTDLGELVSGFAPILRQAAGPCIQLDIAFVGTQPLVCTIDPIHFESALLNLVLNSKDAMPDGGRIVIELNPVQAPRARKRMREPEALQWAQIIVRDDGSGMPRDVLERAFEPFFTTRDGGSGLGLSQVLGFVQQSAGEVRIESRDGAGTTVILLFPTAPDPAQSAGSAAPDRESGTRRGAAQAQPRDDAGPAMRNRLVES
jgi:signal transduction histidine kinase